jgi:hypothetical protein
MIAVTTKNSAPAPASRPASVADRRKSATWVTTPLACWEAPTDWAGRTAGGVRKRVTASGARPTAARRVAGEPPAGTTSRKK